MKKVSGYPLKSVRNYESTCTTSHKTLNSYPRVAETQNVKGFWKGMSCVISYYDTWPIGTEYKGND
jgi:hypothetical protein